MNNYAIQWVRWPSFFWAGLGGLLVVLVLSGPFAAQAQQAVEQPVPETALTQPPVQAAAEEQLQGVPPSALLGG